jgi:hypothetical protein
MVLTRKQQKSLDLFMAKRKEWLEHFAGDDENSITNQLRDLIWMTAVYRVINHSRSYAKQPDGSYANNSMIHHFIDKCFSEYQFISIRRLLDYNKDTTFSLYALICDMEKNTHLITRFNYFKAYNVEYDVGKVKKQYDEYAAQQISIGNNSFYVPPNLLWKEIERRHTVFDTLSNSKSDNRKPTDNVQKSFFENLRNKLGQLEDIKTYAHKFIAHLARPDDRRKNDVDNINITLGKIWKAHEVICKIATLIGKTFLDGCGGFLGTTQFDQFENINKPFIEEENVPELKQVWDKYWEETESWAYFDIDNYNEFIKNEKM